MANKVSFGIEKVFYAKATDDGTGTLTYDTPVAIPGARSISLSASGDTTKWHADNIVYFSSENNNGYEGDLVVAMLPDSFLTDILGEEQDAKGFYVETAGVPTTEFALMFQFEGDENATRHVMYRCTATRPDVASSTVEDSIEPNEQSLTITAMPRINDKVVKAKCPYDADPDSSYAKWYDAVQEPTV